MDENIKIKLIGGVIGLVYLICQLLMFRRFNLGVPSLKQIFIWHFISGSCLLISLAILKYLQNSEVLT